MAALITLLLGDSNNVEFSAALALVIENLQQIIDPGVLQWGALGLLFAVLAGLYFLARLLIDKVGEVAKEFIQRMFNQFDSTLAFVKEEVQSANKERAGNLSAWIEVTREITVLTANTAEALTEIRHALATYAEQSRAALNEVHSALSEIVDSLKAINGKEVSK